MSDDGTIEFRLDKIKDMYIAAGVVCRVLKDGTPVGMIRLKSEEEFQWLKRRMEGDFDLEQELMRNDRHHGVPGLRGDSEGGA